MPDLTIINPGGAGVIYQSLDDEFTAIEPPLWARLIAGYVQDRGYSVEIIDAAAENLSPGEVAARVNGRLVCVAAYGHQPSASTQSMEAAGAICRAIKDRDQKLPIIIVGGHVAALSDRTLLEECCDYVCTGEGPATVVGLLENKGNIPGLAWRWGKTPAAPLIDMKDLHGGVWNLLPMDKYRAHNWQCFDGSNRSPYASIHTTLGCPYKCSFCCINAPFGSNRYRMRDWQSVVMQISYLHEWHKVNTFKISDEMFVLNPRHYLAICEGLAAQKKYVDNYNIWAYARIDTVKADHLALMRRAGIRWLALGIESGSAHVRDGADKSFSGDDIRDVVRAIQAQGINVIGNYIFGLPDDTKETMQQTLDLALDLKCEFANFYTAMPYPGSPLFKATPAKDLPARWSGYSQHSKDCTPLPTATLSSRDVLAFRDEAFQTVFTDPAYLDMLADKFGDGAAQQVMRMTARSLHRDLLVAA